MKKVYLFSMLFFLLLMSAKVVNAQSAMKVLPSGNVQIENINDGSAPTNAKLNLYGINISNIFSKSYQTFGYGDNSKIQVNRTDTRALSVYYDTSLRFYILGEGSIYANGTYISSDKSLKENIQPLENSLEKIMNLRGVKYSFKQHNNSTLSSTNYENIVDDIGNHNQTISAETKTKLDSEKDRLRLGVIADEVEQIVPDAVHTMHNGTKAVAYNELIPLLIEGMKEQQMQIEKLKAELNKLISTEKSATIMNSSFNGITNSELSIATLFQNNPNPFNTNTEIKFFVPNNVRMAEIIINNSSGRVIKSYNVSLFGQIDKIIINSNELLPGLYTYTLVVDGQIVDATKNALNRLKFHGNEKITMYHSFK